MIQLNLLPDVKREFLKAQRLRAFVISITIITSIVAAAIVTILAFYVFGVQQGIRGSLVDGEIDKQSKVLFATEDLDKTLTIQHQLQKISEQHNGKQMYSRLITVLTQMVPRDDNGYTISSVKVAPDTKTITISAQTKTSYKGYETFVKTLRATQIEYTTEGSGKAERALFASNVVEAGGSATRDAVTGEDAFTFEISFNYHEALFARDTAAVRVVLPSQGNATDSYNGVPQSLFKNQTNSDPAGTEE